MLEKIINKKFVNSLLCVQNNEISNAKNLQIITCLGTKIGHYKEIQEFDNRIEKNDHPNVQKQKDFFQKETKLFQDIVEQEEKEQCDKYVLNEFLQLLTNEDVVQRLVDLMSILKNKSTNTRISKTISYRGQTSQNDFDPQVNLYIKGSLFPKVALDFGSQVNILTKRTWENLGRPRLVKSDYYFKLADQGLVEPPGLCKKF